MTNGFDMRDLERFRNELLDFQKRKDAFISDCAKEIAARLLRSVKKRTPVKSGELRRNWHVGDLTINGDTYTIDVINQTEYAMYVEYGHRQTPGRYVPAIGKRLKNNWAKGRFMLTLSTEEIQRQTPAILEQRIQKKLGEYFK